MVRERLHVNWVRKLKENIMEMKYDSIWKIQHIRNGKVIWEDEGHNSITQEGEDALLETYFRGNTDYTPTEFYVRLCNDILVVSDNLVSVVNEPSGNGYSAQLVERSTVGFPTKEMDALAYRLVSKVLSFTASGGDIGPVITAYLTTTSDNTGKLLAFRSLAMTRTIIDGDTMTIQFRIKLS
jgi:hypothetical protein